MQTTDEQNSTSNIGLRGPARAARLAGLLCLSLLLPAAARAAGPGQALVIGEAAYTNMPQLHACALSAHSTAAALRRLGFAVEEEEDASSGAVFAGIATLTRHIKANPDAPVFLYICGYTSAFDERPFLLPVSAQVTRPADLLTQGVLVKSLVDAVSQNTKAPAVVALDAVPSPKAPDSLALDRLAQDLPATVGLLAVRDTASGDQPTRVATVLAGALQGPTVQSAKLLADLKSKLSADPTVQIALLHMPTGNLDLVAPTAPAKGSTATMAVPGAAAPPVPQSSPGAAPPAQAAQSSPAAASSLPDESQMTDAQRRQVQQALATLGYYDGQVDGIFGPETRAAIRRWQHERHVPLTGHLTGTQATQLLGG